jgi:drug/metabolite transporter (DMT)-like permease
LSDIYAYLAIARDPVADLGGRCRRNGWSAGKTLIAVLGGLAAAVAWAGSSLSSSRSSRLADPLAVVAGMMLVGLVICAPIAAAEGVPASLHGSAWLWLALSGAGNVGGLLITYAAFRLGQVSLVIPLVSCEGAIAAVIAVLAGERLGSAAAAALALAVVGVCMASIAPKRDAGAELEQAGTGRHLAAVSLALVAALVFGGSLYATARAGAVLPSAWVVLSARVIGTVALAVPFTLARGLRLPRAALPFVVTSGICEVLGFFAYTLASRHGIAVAAVLSSQFSTLTVIGSYLLFGERLGRLQLVGVCTVIVGVSLISVATA